MNRQEIGAEYFTSGYNCAQAVVLAFKDLINVDENTLIKIAAPFGGGFSRMREVCGAVSGMTMVMGLLYSQLEVNHETKTDIYIKTQEVIRKFEEENGSIVCRDLLGLNTKHENPEPDARTQNYYKKRPCKELVCMAIGYLEDYINTHPYK